MAIFLNFKNRFSLTSGIIHVKTKEGSGVHCTLYKGTTKHCTLYKGTTKLKKGENNFKDKRRVWCGIFQSQYTFILHISFTFTIFYLQYIIDAS